MPEATNSNLRIEVSVFPAKRGSVKARADVRIEFSAFSLTIHGLAIVQEDPANPAWVVNYPQRPTKYGRNATVELTGELRDEVCAAVLAEWKRCEELERRIEEAIEVALVKRGLAPS